MIGFNTFRAVADAAVGDIAAQRALANEAVRITQEEPDIDPETALREGLVFARMAASHGNNSDLDRLIAMLALAAVLSASDGDKRTSDLFRAEQMARLAVSADRGDAEAGDALTLVAAGASKTAMLDASRYQDLLLA